MRPDTIMTDNVRQGMFALAELKRRVGQASQRNAVLIEGLTGRGKTRFSELIYTRDPAVALVTADPDWSASHLMEDIALALGCQASYWLRHNKRMIVAATRRQPQPILIIDEANRLLRSANLLETVRGLHDAGLPLILVGETGLWQGDKGIKRRSQRFADRIGQVLTFGDVSAGDIERAAAELADLRFPRVSQEQPAPLAVYIKERAAGNFRRAAKILEELEPVCKANPGGITRQHVDQALNNLQMKEEREERRVKKAAAGGG